jgi:hypothetical protein
VKPLGYQRAEGVISCFFLFFDVSLNEFDSLDSSQESLTKFSQESLTKKHLTKNILYKNYWLGMGKNFKYSNSLPRDYDFLSSFLLKLAHA